MGDDEIFKKVMSYNEDKHRFIKILNGLPVEEKDYTIDALEDEEVVKQHKLWNCNRYKENIPLEDMTITPRNTNLVFS